MNFDRRLFFRALRISGWSHLWAGVIEKMAHALPEWPHMIELARLCIRFLRVQSWRKWWIKCLKGTGVDTSPLTTTPPSMAEWRYETVCNVFPHLAKLRTLWQHHLRREWWVNPRNRNEVGAAIDCQHDDFFWEFVEVSSKMVWEDASHNRRWGLVCACDEHVRERQEGKLNISCDWNSRRLADAGGHIVAQSKKALEDERKLTPSTCSKKPKRSLNVLKLYYRSSEALPP